mmetsp:Transcript_3076/g.5808  ORF Transcript_3076/g.5808 Transcript_3076/m.5808 type:complete len:192 (+) Transcript_3076:163-738(+)
MLGRANVGKSCLVERFCHNKWSPELGPTVGAAFVAKDVAVSKKIITIGVWDTAGSERYAKMTRHYYQGAEAAVICYDLTDAQSWEKVKFWVKEILAVSEHCILAIVGTKADLVEGPDAQHRGVAAEVVQQYARSMEAKSYETSSKTGHNVDAIFQDVCQVFAERGPRNNAPQGQTIKLQRDQGKGRNCCSQ